jgi:putative ABC transport system permease protein
MAMQWFEEGARDVRYALRGLRSSPGVMIAAVVTLALGIGGSAAMFTVIESVLLRPLGFAQPERLAAISPTSHARLSQAYVNDWRQQSRAFEDMAGWYDVHANLTGSGTPLEVWVDRVTSNFFRLLGVRPLLGRAFAVSPQFSPAPHEVILSYGFWQRRFGGDRAAIGRTVELDGDVFTIVGVMPRGFTIRTNELAESRADVWMPFQLDPGNHVGMGGILNVVGRLSPDATFYSARAELSAIARRIERAYPSYSRDWDIEVTPLLEATVRNARLPLLVMFGATAILLLAACANIATLMLSRALSRRVELAIRRSLGASHVRLVRQLMAESLVLACLGGMLGMATAVWVTPRVVQAIPEGLNFPRAQDIAVDGRVLLFSLGVILLTAILFGLAPALNRSRSSVSLRSESSARGGLRATGNTLVQLEIALALVLLSGAGLLLRSFSKLSAEDPGFRPEDVVTMRLTLSANRYDADDRARAFATDLLERVNRLPGVRAVGTVNYLPMSRIGAAEAFDIEGRPIARAGDQPSSWVSVVGGRYFEAMGIPLLKGRLPSRNDTSRTQPVFVVDEELARRFWPNGDPIGAHLVWHSAGATVTGEVIGVVGGVRWTGMAAERNPTTYFWFPQKPGRELAVVVRTATDPLGLAVPLGAEVERIDPNQPISAIRSMSDFVSDDLAQPRLLMLSLAAFASMALLLSAVGLYAVMAFGVSGRTHEIGVRIALGAQRRDVCWLIMRRVVWLTVSGLAIGVPVALFLGRMVAGLLYGVEPSDPATLAAVAVFLASVALLAGYLPVRRASRVDPIVALRVD